MLIIPARFVLLQAFENPAMLLTIIDRKLGYQGRSIKKIDTYTIKASQFNHVTGEYTRSLKGLAWRSVLLYAIRPLMFKEKVHQCFDRNSIRKER
ncbi:hypothetical protein [Neobacillus novalis]|uniref:hypothetical protein n=1 Tax=Neobacillus novalis TaxID=220687 RepID=UPI001471CA30|nr:hypothetical protein [Neobacillus novalis]